MWWENARRHSAKRGSVPLPRSIISGFGDGLCPRTTKRTSTCLIMRNITALPCLWRRTATCLTAIRIKTSAEPGRKRYVRSWTNMNRMWCILTAVPLLSGKNTVMRRRTIIIIPKGKRTGSSPISRRISRKESVCLILNAAGSKRPGPFPGSRMTGWRIMLPGQWFRIPNINPQSVSSTSFVISYPKTETCF